MPPVKNTCAAGVVAVAKNVEKSTRPTDEGIFVICAGPERDADQQQTIYLAAVVTPLNGEIMHTGWGNEPRVNAIVREIL